MSRAVRGKTRGRASEGVGDGACVRACVMWWGRGALQAAELKAQVEEVEEELTSMTTTLDHQKAALSKQV